MDLLKDDIKKLYISYMTMAFGSTLISSIYGLVDMAMVGQYHGPAGTAALAVFAPVWNIVYSFGLMVGIGGSVLMSNMRGLGKERLKESNEFFTAAVIGGVALSVIALIVVAFFSEPLLMFFGADKSLLLMAQSYLKPIIYTLPCFIFNQLFAAFIRNDGNPLLATAAVLGGGLFNIFGDWFFVFYMDMGIYGAGLATALGSVLSLILMVTHFISRKNSLTLARPKNMLVKLRKVLTTGFPTCITDLAMGIMTVLFNRQIMKYLGTDALAVYGIIVYISTFVQCCGYSIGNASQPIIAINYGAKQGDRVKACLKYAIYTSIAFAVFWTGLSFAAPNMYIRLFMTPTKEVLNIAPGIIRTYALSFVFLTFNVFSTFYFQALMKPHISFVISLARGCIISGGLIMLLPMIAGANAVWFTMPVTEMLVAIYVVLMLRRQ